MKFKEFFLGTPEEKSANDTADALRQKDHLRDRDKRKLEEALALSRRRFLRIGAVVDGNLLIGGVAASHFQSPPSSPTYAEELDGADIQQKTDVLIEKVEIGCANLEAIVATNIAAMPAGLRKKILQNPFELIKNNKNNPNKNGPRFNRQGRLNNDTLVRLDDLTFFSFEARELPNNVAAGFAPASRTMALSPKFDGDNLLHLLLLYHEL